MKGDLGEAGPGRTRELDSPPLEPELLDGSRLSYEETSRALVDLARVNRLLCGSRPLISTLSHRLVAARGRQTLLDLGTGTGDVVGELARHSAKRGVETWVVGVDRKLSHLLIGHEWGTVQARVVADARALPFREAAFDWSCSTLFFHHFSTGDNRRIMAQMRRVARRGVAIVDLRGGRLIRWLTRILLPLLGTGRVALHDGLLSARQSYALTRVAGMVEAAALVELRRRFPCRFSLLLRGGRAGKMAS